MSATPRHNSILLLLTLLLVSACGDPPPQKPGKEEPLPPPPPQATLQGQLHLAPAATLEGPVRLALAWYTGLLSEETSPLSQPRGILTEEVAYSGGFPANYSFDVKAPPPDGALVQLTDGLRGRGAVGVLLAYVDRNGNAALDTIPASGTPVDRVVGASLAWTQPPAFLVVYLDSQQDPATGMKQGFNLVRLDDASTSAVVPLTTPIPLSLREDPLLDAFVCEAAWDDTSEQAPCGITGEEPQPHVLTLGGTITLRHGSADVALTVDRDGTPTPDARVTVEGHVATYDASRQRYTLHLPDAASLEAQGLLTVSASQGGQEVTRMLQVPADFRLTTPTLPAHRSPGATVTVAWTQSSGVQQYEVSVVAGERILGAAVTSELWQTLLPEPYEGEALVRVEGVATPQDGEPLEVRRVRELPLTFSPCDTVTEGSGLTVEGHFEQYAPDLFSWDTSAMHVQVKDDGVAVEDARVTLEGWSVPYVQSSGAYENGFLAAPGYGFGRTLELRVRRGDEELCRTLTVPGDFDLALLTETSPRTGSPLTVQWTHAEGAVQYHLQLGALRQQPLFSVATNMLEWTFPSVQYTGTLSLWASAVAHPLHNDTLGWMDVKLTRLGGMTLAP